MQYACIHLGSSGCKDGGTCVLFFVVYSFDVWEVLNTSTHQYFQIKRQDLMQIYGFRQSLFEEHCGGLHESFSDPGSTECMREVQRRAKESWDVFMGDEIRELPCHIMPYPIQVPLPLFKLAIVDSLSAGEP